MRNKLPTILSCLLLGCGSGIPADDCDPSLPSTGAKRLVAHPKKATQCKIVVMSCNACAYDSQGKLLGTESEFCGVCIGVDF